MTFRLRLRYARAIYISRLVARDEYGNIIYEKKLTPNGSHGSNTQQDTMPPRTRRGGSTEPQKRSIRLTVKAPPSRLQEIKGDEDEEEESARPSRGRPGRPKAQRQSYVEKGTSDEEEEDEEEQDEDAEGDEEEEEDAEGEEDDLDEDDEDADGDIDMDDATPQPLKPLPKKPTIKLSAPATKPGRGRKTSPGTHLDLSSTKHRSVEEKETGDAPSQSESSEVEDDPEGLENGALDEPEDEEMDNDRGDVIKADALNESDLDSDDSNDSSLPDLSKLTRRQRHTEDDGALMALSNEAQKKKFFTPEQITMRRAEMARRRKDLSEKRNEQEKADTLRRLLHKPAPTRRSRAQVLADAEREEFGPGRAGLRSESVAGDEEDGEPQERANRTYTRSVIGYEGSRVGVPVEWLEAPAGKLFEAAAKTDKSLHTVARPSRMVEEVQ